MIWERNGVIAGKFSIEIDDHPGGPIIQIVDDNGFSRSIKLSPDEADHVAYDLIAAADRCRKCDKE